MRFSLCALVVGLLASTVSAAPNNLFQRAACNRDNCLRAVGPTASSASIRGSTDCASFLQATVYACLATNTVTTTATVSANPVTTTLNGGAMVTSTVTTTVSTTSVGSATVTSTATASSVTTLQASVTSTITSTITSSFTVTSTSTPLAKRQNACTQETTVIPTATPSYASACQNTSRYSSACSCLGFTSASTTTIATASTSISTTTVSVTVTPTVTVAGGAGSTKTVTASTTVTMTSSAISSVATTTTVVSSTTTMTTVLQTVSTTVSTTATITTASPTAVTTNLSVNFPDGHAIDINENMDVVPSTSEYYVPVAILSDASVASAENKAFKMVTSPRSAGGYTVKFIINPPSSTELHCSIPNNAVASGAFTCSYADQNASFYLCDGVLTIGTISSPVTGCSATTLTVSEATYNPVQ